MDGRGWGSVALESDHHHHQSHHTTISANNTLTNTNTNTPFISNHHHNTLTNINNMRGGNNNQLFQGVDLSVNLNRRGGDDDHDRDRDLDHQENNDDDDDDNKVVVDEVDFFSNHKSANTTLHHHDHDHHRVINSPRDHHPAPAVPDPTPDIRVNTGLHLLTTNTGSDQSTIDDGTSPDVEDKRAKNELAVLQAELKRINNENQKLKSTLSQVSQDYNALQMHLVALMQQQQLQKGVENAQQSEVVQQGKDEEQNIVPRQFIDLGPSTKVDTDERTTSQTLSDDEKTLDRSGSPHNNTEVVSMMSNNNKNISQYDQHNGKNTREASPEDSDAQGNWTPNKAPKLSPPPKSNSPVDQATAEATMRKARVSVRARSEAPMISDGCQWRKYGQKMAKGNPCPRAYYRCTMAVGCPVRKQVQRCAEDRSILITTYEGNHNHPLPPAAMAMASTTSAAASMLLSGSMPSGDGLMNPNFLARTILPCSSSMATISASAPFPTVTLDLTHSPNPLQIQRPTGAQPNSPFPFPAQNGPLPPNFLASMPQLFTQALYNNNQSKFSGLHSSSGTSSLQLPNQNAAFADSLSAATAAIANDPNFTAALAAAISSIIGGKQAENAGNSAGATTTSGNSNGNNNVVNSSSTMQQQ